MDRYYCERAKIEFDRVLSLLQTHRLLAAASAVGPGDAARFIRHCDPCTRAKKQKQCLGWHLVIPRDRPITLGDFELGRRVQIDIEVDCRFHRPAPARADSWRSAPAASADLGVLIYDADSPAPKHERLLERHHVDLANPGQPGPVWHLQLGGNVPGDAQHPTGWLEVPRWHVLPVDFTLLTDLVIFNFAYDKWLKLHADPTWTMAVKKAEDLMYPSFAELFCNHMSRSATERKWTLGQLLDNQSHTQARWDPRPQ